jgi:hypothetical protein
MTRPDLIKPSFRERVTRFAEGCRLALAIAAGVCVRLGSLVADLGRDIEARIERLSARPEPLEVRTARLLELTARRRGFWDHDEARSWAELVPERLSDFPAEARQSLNGIQAELNRRLWRELSDAELVAAMAHTGENHRTRAGLVAERFARSAGDAAEAFGGFREAAANLAAQAEAFGGVASLDGRGLFFAGLDLGARDYSAEALVEVDGEGRSRVIALGPIEPVRPTMTSDQALSELRRRLDAMREAEAARSNPVTTAAKGEANHDDQ